MNTRPAGLEDILQRIAEIKRRFNRPLVMTGGGFQNYLAAAAAPPPSAVAINPSIEASIAQSAAQHNLDPALVKAVVQAESGFDPTAVSRTGAQGLMQLMPATGAQLGLTNPFDPYQNIAAGSKYLRQLMDSFNGNTSLAIAAYNAGPGAVQKYNGIPPYPETQQYVQRVLGLAEQYRSEERK